MPSETCILNLTASNGTRHSMVNGASSTDMPECVWKKKNIPHVDMYLLQYRRRGICGSCIVDGHADTGHDPFYHGLRVCMEGGTFARRRCTDAPPGVGVVLLSTDFMHSILYILFLSNCLRLSASSLRVAFSLVDHVPKNPALWGKVSLYHPYFVRRAEKSRLIRSHIRFHIFTHFR